MSAKPSQSERSTPASGSAPSVVRDGQPPLAGDARQTAALPSGWGRLAALLSALQKRIDRVPPRVRNRIPLVVLGGGALIQFAFWLANEGDASRQVITSWYILPTTAFLVVLWWLFLAPFTVRLRLAGAGVLIAGAGAFVLLFRVKEFSGDMVPHFELRWQPSAEERAAEYFTDHNYLTDHKGSVPPSNVPPSNVPPAEISPKDLPAMDITDQDWPQFEGPTRSGQVHGIHPRTDWNAVPPRMLWRHPVGAAWSSFAVVGKYAYTQEQRGADEAVVCYDADTGKQIWVHLDRGVRFSAELAGVGPRATPTVFGARLFTQGASGILNCFEPRTGRLLWSHNVITDAGVSALMWGVAGSPLAYDQVVVVNAGGPRKSMKDTEQSGRALIAYDQATGKRVWTSGNYLAGYSSPIVVKLDGVRQVVIFDGVGAGGYDAATGKELWRSEEWTNEYNNNIAQPIVFQAGSVFLSSGYGTGSLLFDVRHTVDGWTATRRYAAPNKFRLKFNTGVYRSDCVYGLDEGILACFDLWSATLSWKKGRYGFGQVLLLEDALLVLSEAGDVIALNVSKKGSRELGRFHAIDGKTWNHPAISRGRLYVRNAEEAACYDLNRDESATR